jgi:hypothetical protein
VVPQEGVGRRAFRRQRHAAQQAPQPQQAQHGLGAAGDATSAGSGGGSTEAGAVFLEPMQWMAPSIVGGPTQGKLYCPQCGTRLGSFNWAGV